MVFLVIIIGLLVSIIPLASPGAMIILSAIVWPIVYGIIYFLSSGFDLTQSLPWYVADPERATANLIVFFALLGLVRGPAGSLAMLSIWVPIFMLPTFLLNLGVAVENKAGWIGYVYDNYQDNCSDLGNSYVCKYTPLDGRKIPTFVQDNSVGREKVLSVTPYNSFSVNNKVESSDPDGCATTVTKSEGSETTTTVCYF